MLEYKGVSDDVWEIDWWNLSLPGLSHGHDVYVHGGADLAASAVNGAVIPLLLLGM